MLQGRRENDKGTEGSIFPQRKNVHRLRMSKIHRQPRHRELQQLENQLL